MNKQSFTTKNLLIAVLLVTMWSTTAVVKAETPLNSKDNSERIEKTEQDIRLLKADLKLIFTHKESCRLGMAHYVDNKAIKSSEKQLNRLDKKQEKLIKKIQKKEEKLAKLRC